MDIDPRLRDNSQEDTTGYGQSSIQSASYALDPIRLPPPPTNNTGLPPLPHNTSHPYHAFQQKPGEQIFKSSLPVSQVSGDPELLQPSRNGVGYKDDLKRSRACEACRGLKVRCVPDPNNGRCKRCAKAGRGCVITAPSRKRQKKTDSKVAELEKRIDALTASIQATRNQEAAASDSDASGDGQSREADTASGPGTQAQRIAQHQDAMARLQQSENFSSNSQTIETLSRKRRRSVYSEANSVRPRTEIEPLYPLKSHPMNASETGQGLQDCPANQRQPNVSAGLSQISQDNPLHYADVVDRKILDAETASKIFRHYTANMAPHMPAVVFSSTTTSDEIRRTKPTLFLAILSVATGHDYPNLQKLLLKEITRKYADLLICKNNKSIELIQALQISTLWYSPEEYKDAKPYQLIILASIMAYSMGLGQPKHHVRGLLKELRYSSPASREEVGLSERRRAWISCYILCGLTAMTLKLPNLFRWNAYMEDCINDFSTSSDSLPSDVILGRWATLQRIKDDIALRYEVENTSTPPGPHSLETDKTLARFKERLDEWENQTLNQISSASLALALNISKIHLLQIGVRFLYCTDAIEEHHPLSKDYKATKDWDVPKSCKTDTVGICVKSIHGMLDNFLSLSVDDVRTIPTFHFIQIAYAVICLLRISRGAKKSGSELGKIISAATTEADPYINRLLDLMQKAAADGKCRPAQTFQLALRTIKTWFESPTISGCQETVSGTTTRDVKIDPPIWDTERGRPNPENQKISFTSGNTITQATQESPKPEPPDMHQIQQPQYPLNQQIPQTSPLEAPTMAATPLHLLSQVATSSPARSIQHHPASANSEAWYTNNNTYASYPPTEATHASYAPTQPSNVQVPFSLSIPTYYSNPLSYADTAFGNGMGTAYQGTSTDIEFQQAFGMPYGQEVDLCAMFMDDEFLPPSGAAGLGDWEGGA